MAVIRDDAEPAQPPRSARGDGRSAEVRSARREYAPIRRRRRWPPFLRSCSTHCRELPEGLEYRFMGNDLVLRDTKANLIADFINNAVPTVLQTR